MHEPRAKVRQILLFIAGMVGVVSVGWVVVKLWPKQPLPEGWLRLTTPSDVMALAEVKGEIWAGGRDGLFALNPQDGSLLRQIEADVPLKYVTGIAQSTDVETVWISHMRGTSRYDGRTWHTLTEADGLTGGRALAVLIAHDRARWIGTEEGVARCTDTRCRRYTTDDGLVTQGCAYLFEDSLHRVWCGNGYQPEAGVSIFEDGAWHAMDAQGQLVHPMLNTMLEAPEGTLWFGTGFSADGGLSIYRTGQWSTLTKADGLAGAKVRSLFQDEAGAVWVGSEYNGILRMAPIRQTGSILPLDPPTGQVFTPEMGLAGWEVKAMLQDSQGTLWLGTELGLTRISHKAWLALGSAESPTSPAE
jgi:ligand-binding sensor domain-containing protein